MRRLLAAFIVLSLFATPGSSQNENPATPVGEQSLRARYAVCQRLARTAREHLRNDQITDAMRVLGQAADLELPHQDGLDDGLASAAAAVHRRLAALDVGERFEVLRAWTMPTESRRTVRVLTTITPTLAPPTVFARALGERPRRDSFAVPEVGGVPGLFSTGWELVRAADASGRLRRFTREVEQLVEKDVPNARIVLMLARIAAAGRADQQLVDELTVYATGLADPSANARLLSLAQRVWLFGSGRFDDAKERTTSFQVFPHWHATRLAWCGGSAYPKTETGWCLVKNTGGSPGADHAAIRRWVAPTAGTVSITGELERPNENGNGIHALIVSSRLGPRGKWLIRSGSIATGVEAVQVQQGDTIDFVVDCIERDANFDQFSWPVRLDLQTNDGETVTFDSVSGFHGPVESNADLSIAGACLTKESLLSIGERILKTNLAQTYDHESRLMRPFLRRALATAINKRYPDASLDVAEGSDLDLWIPSSVQESGRHVQGAVRSTWLTHEDHTMHLAGPRSDYVFFRYPLTGEFEFSCDAQIGGPGGTDGCIGYGGLGYELWAAQQSFKVWTANHEQVARFDCPFVANNSLATFNRFLLMSTANGVTVSCNGHPTWTDTGDEAASPWIALRSYGSAAPIFRNLQLTGDPVIPREVKMSEGDSLRGWTASYYSERMRNEDADWFLKDGVVHGSKSETASVNPQSWLYYMRPLMNGESISYEFQYEAGQLEVHPALGRIAFLIERGGVRLHWMTDGDREWTGLAEDNAVVEPLNRRGPRPLRLVAGEWNRATIELKNDTLTLSLNDTKIYVRKMEPDVERTFGFYHDKSRSEVRVRNVVMRGDWPEKLAERQLNKLMAVSDPDRSKSDRQFLGAIFDDRHIHGSVLALCTRAAAIPPEQRYEFLSDWVLPTDNHATLRMAVDSAPTNPAPPFGNNSGDLVAPALDLVAVANEIDRLAELRDRVDSFAPTNGEQQRARLSMQALIAMAEQDFELANQHLEQLAELVLSSPPTSFLTRGPETLAMVASAEFTETRSVAREMAWHILETQIRKQQPSGSEAWDQHVDALANRLQFLVSLDEGPAGQKELADLDDPIRLANWLPVSYATARTRGRGLPHASWHVAGHQVRKTSGHEQDYLYYRVPLRGNYEVECDLTSTAWQTMELMVAGNWVGPWWNRKAYVFGNFREQQPLRDLTLPLAGQKNQWARYRAVVRDGVCTTYFNGRELHEQQLSDDCEPWLAIRGTANTHGAVRDLRISGNPIVPEQINLATSPELPGWISYFEGTVGAEGDWRSNGSAIVGVANPELAGSHQEDLLRYHRPMIEDGVIEYEFFYRAGEIHVHPALDRLAFMLQPDGVRLHWITDGAYDRTRLAPNNLFDEPDNRRGNGPLPLKSADWNRLQLSLTDDVVDLTLNGQLIFQRKLEPTNQRTFGMFRYADRTEARVRNIIWRGDWPRELPAPTEQELSANDTNFLDESLPELTATFHHDFVEDGLPSELFGITDGRTEHFDARREGLLVTQGPGKGYQDTAVGPLLYVGGEFDIVAEFERFAPHLVRDGTSGIALEAALDGDESTRCLLILRHFWDSARSKPVVRLAYNDRKIGGVRRDRSPAVTSEATAGKLRLARRGDTVYYLFAENDSPSFRLIGTQEVTKDEAGRVRLVTDTHRQSLTRVVWKSLTIRASKLSGLALLDQEQLVADLNEQRDALPERFDHDFAKDPLTEGRFSRWGAVPPLPEESGVRIIAPGTNKWTSVGVSPQLGLVGDFDIAATFHELSLAEPRAGLYSDCSFRVTFSDERQTMANITLVEKTAGGPEVFAQIYYVDGGGNQVYRRVRLEAVEAISRLRLARRGKQLSFVYREAGSDRDQILTRVDIDDGPIPPGNIRLQLHTGGGGRQSSALLKDLRAYAEKIDPSPADGSPVLEALTRQLTGEQPKHALEFDGLTQHVTVPSIRYDGSHPITLEAFVTPDQTKNCIMANTQRAGVGLSINGRDGYNIHAWNRTNYDRAAANAPAGRLLRVHVAGTFDGKQMQIFVNGKLRNTKRLNGVFIGSDLPMTIGASPSPRASGIDFPFDGIIDQVRISKTVRYTQDFEVPGELKPDESAIAVYRFDEGKDETLGDSSGNNHHGQLRGARWVTGEAIRQRAAQGLAEFGRFAVPVLIDALHHEAPEVRQQAIEALRMIGPDAHAALPHLKVLTKSEDKVIANAAARTVTLVEGQRVLNSIKKLFDSSR